MALILVTQKSSRNTFNINEIDIVKMYEKGSDTVIEHIDSDSGLLKVAIVDESAVSLYALSTILVQTAIAGITIYLNSNRVVNITEINSLAVITYNAGGDKNEILKLSVDEATFLASLPSGGRNIKEYDALFSQNAPIASTANSTMVAGQIWELSGAANPSDYAFFDGLELISGTLYAIGSKYRASSDTPFTLSASAIEYDGAPYIVSKDANGNLNPFINTLGVNPVFSRDGVGIFYAYAVGLFLEGKVGATSTPTTFASAISIYRFDDDYLEIDTINMSGVSQDGYLWYTPINIKIRP